MAGQHMENLFRRFKGEVVRIKTVSGATFEGRIAEITNDYVCLSDTRSPDGEQQFLFFDSIESMVKTASSTD